MSTNLKCPQCGSTKVIVEKRLDGTVECTKCNYSGKRIDFEVTVSDATAQIDNYVKVKRIKQLINTLTSEGKQLVKNFVNQLDEPESVLTKKISDQTQLIKFYEQLCILRNDQLKDVPAIQRGKAMELDVVVCANIRKLKIKMGLVVAESENLISGWDELSRVPPSKTHKLEIDVNEGSGWIVPLKDDPTFEDSYYLSTHSFYGKTYKQTNALLRKCGFDVQVTNWD